MLVRQQLAPILDSNSELLHARLLVRSGHGLRSTRFEFRFVCRNVLKLPDDNASLKLVFAHLDLMGTGKVSVEAMVSFVAKGAVSLEACMELLGQASWSNRSLIGGLREPSCRRPADGSREGSREMSQSNHRGWMGSHC